MWAVFFLLAVKGDGKGASFLNHHRLTVRVTVGALYKDFVGTAGEIDAHGRFARRHLSYADLRPRFGVDGKVADALIDSEFGGAVRADPYFPAQGEPQALVTKFEVVSANWELFTLEWADADELVIEKDSKLLGCLNGEIAQGQLRFGPKLHCI